MSDELTSEDLREEVVSAWRDRNVRGEIVAHPSWHDLTESDRVVAARATLLARTIEAALDPRGHTSTTKAVLSRISPQKPG